MIPIFVPAPLTVLSLFSGGVDGLGLAAEVAGMEVVAFCEIDPYCRSVLAVHFPGRKVYDDIHTLTRERLERDGLPAIDVVAGGPPCQAASIAGQRRGDRDERWLWPEFLRVCGDVRPKWLVAENPVGILSIDGRRAFGGLLREVAALGYCVGYSRWTASAVGAPHKRERVFLIARRDERGVGQADPQGDGWQQGRAESTGQQGRSDVAECDPCGVGQAHADRPGWAQQRRAKSMGTEVAGPKCGCGVMAHSDSRESQRGRDSGVVGGPQATQCADLQERERDGHTTLDQGAPAGIMVHAECAGLERRAGERDNGTRWARRLSATGRGRERGQREIVCPLGVYVDGAPADMVRWHRWPARPGQEQFPWEPPRLSAGEPNRVAALKALGNAVVWRQALPIFTAIAEEEGMMAEGGAR